MDRGRYTAQGQVMVIEKTSTGTSTYYPSIRAEYGHTSNINDSVFGDGAGGAARRGILLGIYNGSGDCYHSTSTMQLNTLEVLDHDDQPLHLANFFVGLNSVPAFRMSPATATNGGAETRMEGCDDLWIPIKNGLKVRITKNADSGIMIYNIIYAVVGA